MTLIQKYYIKDFLRLFGILSLGLSTIASLIELINRIDDFMPQGPSLAELIYYCLLNIPNLFLYTMPVSILLSSLFVMGSAGRRRETVAIRSSGGSLKKILSVFIITGLIMTALAFLTGEFVSPPALREAHRLKGKLSKKGGDKRLFWGDKIWMRSKEAIIKIDLYLQDREVIKGISIFRMNGDRLLERIEADYGEWNPSLGGNRKVGGLWVLKKGVRYNIETGEVMTFRELPVDLIGSPEVFREGARKPEEMNLRELIHYTKRLKEAGFKNKKLLVDIQSRIAYPLINLIMMILGLSLAVSGEMRSGLITAAIGIGISLFYWLCLSLVLSMSYTGILPAFGPWLIPIIFGLFSIYRFSRIPE